MTRENLRALGLKTDYKFREVHIPIPLGDNAYQACLLNVVSPTVQSLENHNLINGFHFIMHDNIDLRLSCDDWPKNESEISNVLVKQSVNNKLEPWSMPQEQYGGELGLLLCYNNLEHNSRLCLALIALKAETTSDRLRAAQERLCPSQWIHYLFTQYGMNNIQQIVFQINDALSWMQTLQQRNPNNDNVRSLLQNVTTKAEQEFSCFRNALDR